MTPSLQMGDLGYLKNTATPGHLQEKWRGPFKVILTTPMAAKKAGFPSWVHIKNLKMAAPSQTYQFLLTGPRKIKISCIPEDRDIPTKTPGVYAGALCLGTWCLAYLLSISLPTPSFLSVPAHTFTLSYIPSIPRSSPFHLFVPSISLPFPTSFTLTF
jgi:hypothetical protein